MVELTGFEPAASSSRTRRATKLRHSPIAAGGARSGRQARRAYRSVWGVPNPTEQSGVTAPGRPRHSVGVSVSRVASGRQATRIGAYGEVPTPAETCNHEEPGSPGRETA